ncbi:MAG: hypothetical protein GX754_09220 [Clostridiaceae bacterium]|nr:hypothetical protein [Clostridiaceae bacterium]
MPGKLSTGSPVTGNITTGNPGTGRNARENPATGNTPAGNPALNNSPVADFLEIKPASNAITGLVYLDSNCNGIRDGNEIPLENVRINLFQVKVKDEDETFSKKHGKSSNNISNNAISILQEKLIGHTFTDKNGKFSFPVKAGFYSVNLDINTLPEGTGIPEPDILVIVNIENRAVSGNTISTGNISKTGKKEIIEFGARNVALIEINNDTSLKYHPGQEIILSAVPRDECGIALASKINYSCEDNAVELRNNVARIKEMVPSYRKYTIRASCGKVYRDIPITLGQFPGDCLCAIYQAYQNGIINKNTKIRLYLESLHGRYPANSGFWSELPVKCGERAIKEIRDYIARKTSTDKKLAEDAKQFFCQSFHPLMKLISALQASSKFITRKKAAMPFLLKEVRTSRIISGKSGRPLTM